MSKIAVFAPSPTLTVAVEEHPSGVEIHIHAGGQGVWQSRMLGGLGLPATLCCTLTGESGVVLKHLLEDQGIAVAAVERSGRGSAYLHDRRGGQRAVIAEESGDPLGRHDLDELYSLTVREGLDAGMVILSGADSEKIVPADTYRRLAADLRSGGARVLVDLSGERLRASVAGGVDVLKVSDDELLADGIVETGDTPAIMAAMRTLQGDGAEAVIVTRAEHPLLLLDAEGFLEVTPPSVEPVQTKGAGDSLTAGVACAMAHGESPREAVTLGAAAGALNVTRHGLGTGDSEAIARLRSSVTTRRMPDTAEATTDDEEARRVSPDDLAGLAAPEPREQRP
jgi:1-phosphofructokinase